MSSPWLTIFEAALAPQPNAYFYAACVPVVNAPLYAAGDSRSARIGSHDGFKAKGSVRAKRVSNRVPYHLAAGRLRASEAGNAKKSHTSASSC